MATQLLENYKARLAISEQYYSQKNDGARMPASKKMLTAMCLQNVSKYLNEAYANTVGTNVSDLGAYKRFCMDITTLVVPNLIVTDMFMTQPMSSFSGYVTYLYFGLGTEKGGVGGVTDGEFNTIISSPFTLGEMTEARANYSGSKVVEPVDSFVSGTTKIAWTPIAKDAAGAPIIKFLDANGAELTATNVSVAADGTVTATIASGTVKKLAYEYNNIQVPQAKLPTLAGKMKGITLTAKARRLAVEYSQFAAFMSKNDYGIDFEQAITQQAQAELNYQIDAEAVFLVKKTADSIFTDVAHGLVQWVDEELDTVSYSMKAEGFARKLEQAKAVIYKKTKRFAPNWMLVSPDVMPILTFVPGFKAASSAIANGPYVAGEVAGMKVIVSPALEEKVCYLGVLGADGKTATGIFAPYLPIMPTQLLGMPDGTMTQGFASMYDMKILNDNLLAKIAIVDGNNAALYEEYVETSAE